MLSPSLPTTNWDRAYNSGKYFQDKAILFVDDIVDYLKEERLQGGLGFYPGCGNGRNLVLLLEYGLDIEACDISEVAIKQLRKRYPKVKAEVGDFLSTKNPSTYDYLLSIQLFQHVNEHGPEPLFEKVNQLLRPGGLFFLRVNSISTQIAYDHLVTGKNTNGGFTIRYESGPKRGQLIHFYAEKELVELTHKNYEILSPATEKYIKRSDDTKWCQWEMILKRKL